MEKELIAAVRQHILDVEKEYNERMECIEGIGQAEKALRSIENMRAEKLRRGQDVTVITEFLAETRQQFNEMVNMCLEDDNVLFNFSKWAQDMQRDVRAENPSMISFASICEGDVGSDGNWTVPHSTGISHGAKSVKSFIQILQSNGRLKAEENQSTPDQARAFFWASSTAWTCAVIGMVIALGFLTSDFYGARTNLALHLDRKETPNMPYPAVTICTDIPRVPLFLDFPTDKYPGTPLFGLSMFSWRNSSDGKIERIKFPATIPRGENGFEEILSGPRPESCQNMKKQTSVDTDQRALFTLGDLFNISKIEQRKRKGSLDSSKECYWCVRVGAKRKIRAHLVDSHGSGPSAPPYQLNFFRSKFTEGCTTMSGFRNRKIRVLIARQLRIHSKALVDHGVLDFGGFPPGHPRVDALSAIEHGFNHTSIGGGDYVAGMAFACNVYFYTGYFYPTEGAPDIRYRYEHVNKSWVQTGSGPFYTTRVWDQNAKDIIGPGNLGVEIDRYTTNHAQILFQDPDFNNSRHFVPIEAKIANIESSRALFLDVERREERGKIGYIVDVQSIGTQTGEGLAVSGFTVGMAYRSKFTQRVSSVATMAWSSYLTDVFEFVGLFTGVCVFTLFVAPAHTLVKS